VKDLKEIKIVRNVCLGSTLWLLSICVTSTMELITYYLITTDKTNLSLSQSEFHTVRDGFMLRSIDKGAITSNKKKCFHPEHVIKIWILNDLNLL
jgi:hypothetical protein